MCFSNKDSQDDSEPARLADATDNQQRSISPQGQLPQLSDQSTNLDEADDSDLTNIIGHYIRSPTGNVSDRPNLKKLRLFILRSLTMAIIMRRKLGHNDIVLRLEQVLTLLYRKSEKSEAARELQAAFNYDFGLGKYDEENAMHRESLLLYAAEAAGCLYQYKPDMAIELKVECGSA